MSPGEFWSLHPTEFFWLAEAKKEQVEADKRGGRGVIDEQEAVGMLDELRRARAKMGLDIE